MKRKCAVLMIAVLLVFSCSKQTAKSTGVIGDKYKPGSYTAEATGYGGTITVSVEVSKDTILKLEILSNSETAGIGSKAVEALPAAILKSQSATVDGVSGATVSSQAIKKAVLQALNEAAGITEVNSTEGDTKQARLFDEGWSVKPVYGITKGNYYKEQEKFRQGHTGIFEVVTDNEGKLLMVEFNETGRPNYYVRVYQNQDKRLSEYNVTMGERKGVAFIQGVIAVEQQMLNNQSLTAKVDTLSGASNSVQQGMLPLAKKIADRMPSGTKQKYYSIAKDVGGGLSGKLDLVIENGKIIDCRYDEIFADSPEEISAQNLKAHYRTSKYSSIYYEEPSRIGFNVQMDALNNKVTKTQNLFDLTDLPATEESGDYKTTGFTLRNTAWDNYLALAKELAEVMQKDGVFTR